MEVNSNVLTDQIARIRFDGVSGWVLDIIARDKATTYRLNPKLQPPPIAAQAIISGSLDVDFKPFPGGWRGYLTPHRERVPNIFAMPNDGLPRKKAKENT